MKEVIFREVIYGKNKFYEILIETVRVEFGDCDMTM